MESESVVVSLDDVSLDDVISLDDVVSLDVVDVSPDVVDDEVVEDLDRDE